MHQLLSVLGISSGDLGYGFQGQCTRGPDLVARLTAGISLPRLVGFVAYNHGRRPITAPHSSMRTPLAPQARGPQPRLLAIPAPPISGEATYRLSAMTVLIVPGIVVVLMLIGRTRAAPSKSSLAAHRIIMFALTCRPCWHMKIGCRS